jgi:5-methylcytosine-specific restriction endonuclease McrA
MNLTTCFFCKLKRPEDEMYRPSGRRPQCHECRLQIERQYRARYEAAHPGHKAAYMREYQKGYRKGYRKTQKGRAARKRYQSRYHSQNAEWVWSIKRGPCADCGQRFHPCAMDFDHLPQYTKRMEISDMVRSKRSRGDIELELAKCELVCANCHRVRTFTRQGPVGDMSNDLAPPHTPTPTEDRSSHGGPLEVATNGFDSTPSSPSPPFSP